MGVGGFHREQLRYRKQKPRRKHSVKEWWLGRAALVLRGNKDYIRNFIAVKGEPKLNANRVCRLFYSIRLTNGVLHCGFSRSPINLSRSYTLAVCSSHFFYFLFFEGRRRCRPTYAEVAQLDRANLF